MKYQIFFDFVHVNQKFDLRDFIKFSQIFIMILLRRDFELILDRVMSS
jgi:hypothetical protein